jgi:hypothetical protein
MNLKLSMKLRSPLIGMVFPILFKAVNDDLFGEGNVLFLIVWYTLADSKVFHEEMTVITRQIVKLE